MKCSGGNVILHVQLYIVSSFSLHFLLYRGNLDCYSNSVIHLLPSRQHESKESKQKKFLKNVLWPCYFVKITPPPPTHTHHQPAPMSHMSQERRKHPEHFVSHRGCAIRGTLCSRAVRAQPCMEGAVTKSTHEAGHRGNCCHTCAI